ncbi:DUF6361 family protein [Janibacter cremeus]|uniref:Phosphoribosyl-ATP pyrophosphohydrolase n=1 Tax=Janibacter cremeus TaxID=1285192 RepID=A0A852VSV0_9MICO|nr:DUF6361 family protein [Janibacter cremeus]NYF96895.1 phosphoribosyl-ATP pyrophosphohydrolase [Janibacter cremeus]
MPSTIGWLDTTADQQRIAREMVSLFMVSESRDELGIGQIRDVMSNWMFPGTSVLQARARYFVLVPWCHLVAEQRARGRGRDLAQQVREVQLEMIETMRRDHEEAEGLIGKQAGRSLKGLPRDLFWTGLVTFDIRRSESDLPRAQGHAEGEVTEMTSRQTTAWDPDLPPVPTGFPDIVPGGLDMSANEAQWLYERMRTDREDTYLAHLLALDPELIAQADAPWQVATETTFASVQHARQFSLVMEGASLLYNLLVAERYEEHADLNRLDGGDLGATYRGKLARWGERLTSTAPPGSWDLDNFITEVNARNRRISNRTWAFVVDWVTLLRDEDPVTVADSPGGRRLISLRESRKGAKSRLTDNSKTLETWSGNSGSGALTFRWDTIKTLVLDVNQGHGTQGVADADA